MKLLDWLLGTSPADLATHTTTMDITLKCPECGGTNFKAPSTKPVAHDKLTCAQCDTAVDLSAETRRIEKEIRAAVKARAGS
jgi:hypothetical protein